MLIKVIDAADFKLCLLLRFFAGRKLCTTRLDTHPRARVRGFVFHVASTVWEILAVKPCKFAQCARIGNAESPGVSRIGAGRANKCLRRMRRISKGERSIHGRATILRLGRVARSAPSWDPYC
jgi:hypothetical protein